jgi:hypothetical protein
MAGALEKNRAEASHRGMGMRGLLNFFGLAPLVLALAMLVGGGSADAATNKCGCTLNESNNSCSCSKGAKCGCPGECEPKGCEEKREAQRKKEIDAETKKAAEADRKHRASSGSEAKTGSAKMDKSNGDNGKAETASGPSGTKMSAAQTKQLGKLLDGYLKAHPDARSKNAEELRNELTLTPR